MIKIQMVDTGEIKEVTRNEAHGLIDSGKARMYRKSGGYNIRQVRPDSKVSVEVEVDKSSQKSSRSYKTK